MNQGADVLLCLNYLESCTYLFIPYSKSELTSLSIINCHILFFQPAIVDLLGSLRGSAARCERNIDVSFVKQQIFQFLIQRACSQTLPETFKTTRLTRVIFVVVIVVVF